MLSGSIITFIPEPFFFTNKAHLPGWLKHPSILQKEFAKIGGSGLRSSPSYDSFSVSPLNRKDPFISPKYLGASKNCRGHERAL